MIRFKTNKISVNTDNIGEQLRQARLAQNLQLEEVAQKLNINLKYLKALENSQLEKLPAGIYGKNFLREYAQFLKVNVDKLIDIFNNETGEKQNRKQKNLFSKKIPRAHYFLTVPKIIKNIIIAVIVLICTAYLGYCLIKIISPPKLIIVSPAEDLVAETNDINIQGLTDQEAEVTINGESVLINASGYFTKKVNLKNGLNTIFITAQKKYSRKNNIVRNILVKD